MKVQRTMTARERTLMRAMRASGASVLDIAAEVDRHPSVVRRYVRDIPSSARHPNAGAPIRARVVALREKGLTHEQIAARLDMRPSTVAVHLHNDRRARAGRILDGVEHNHMPASPAVPPPAPRSLT